MASKLVQDLEHADWDEAVLSIAPGGTAPPIAQILLANRLGNGANRTFQAFRRVPSSQVAMAFPIRVDGFFWMQTAAFHLTALEEEFQEDVAQLLIAARAIAQLDRTARLHLNGLIFHPLQNALEHGLGGGRGLAGRLSGISVRKVAGLHPAPPSYLAYLEAHELAASSAGDRFLELVVHDDGPGIATHFYNASHGKALQDLTSLAIAREWNLLKLAFELHHSSKLFQKQVGSGTPMAGFGLAGLVNAARFLRAYIEIRTGRFRGYFYPQPRVRTADQDLLSPAGVPPSSPYLRGTIIRMVVPLRTNGT